MSVKLADKAKLLIDRQLAVVDPERSEQQLVLQSEAVLGVVAMNRARCQASATG